SRGRALRPTGAARSGCRAAPASPTSVDIHSDVARRPSARCSCRHYATDFLTLQDPKQNSEVTMFSRDAWHSSFEVTGRNGSKHHAMASAAARLTWPDCIVTNTSPEREPARHSVPSHPAPVALVGECSIPVV